MFVSLKRKVSKTMAVILAVCVLVSAISVSLISGFALSGSYDDVFTVTVTDKHTSAVIENATVTIIPEDDSIAQFTGITGADGVAVIQAVTDYFALGNSAFEAKYTVSATNYKDYTVEQAVQIADEKGNIDVALEDSVKPVVKNVSGNPTDWICGDVAFTIESDDTDIAEYKLGAGAWQTTADFAISANGNYEFFIKDKAGNVSDAYVIDVTYIDNDAPEISGAVFDPDEWTNKVITMTVNASDNGCGSIMYKMDDGAWQTSEKFEVENNSKHYIYVKDALGNETTVGYEVEATKFDNVKPEIKDVKPQDGWSNTSIKFTVEATDNKSGVAFYSVNDNSETANWQASNEFVITDTNEYTYYVKDNAGNISEGYVAPVAKIDTTIPQISEVKLSTEEFTSETVIFTVEAADEANGSGIVEYRMDGGAWQTENTFNVNDDQKHNFEVKDAAGNISLKFEKAAEKFIGDEDRPVIDKITASAQDWTNQKVTLTVEATAKKTNNAIKEYRMDGGNWQTSNKFEITDNIEHVFYVRDLANKESLEAKYQFNKFDNVKPELDGNVEFELKNNGAIAKALHFLTFGNFFNEEWEITVKAKDLGVDGCVSKIENAELIFTDANDASNSVTKTYTDIDEEIIEFVVDAADLEGFKGSFKVKLCDYAGNEEVYDITDQNSNLLATEFMVETVAPVIEDLKVEGNGSTVIKNGEKYTVSGDVEIPLNVKDADSGIYSVNVILNGEKTAYLDVKLDAQLIKEYETILSTENKTPDADGAYKFDITVIDNAGNVSTDTITVEKDLTSPVITDFEFAVNGEKEEVPTGVTITDYGYFFNKAVDVTIKAEDQKTANECVAGVKEITTVLVDKEGKYYTVENDGDIIEITSIAAAIARPVTNNEVEFRIEQNFKGQIYAFATDNVGNNPSTAINEFDVTPDDVVSEKTSDLFGYKRPNGSVLESPVLHTTTSSIVITATEKTSVQNESYAFQYSSAGQKDKEMSYDDSQKVPLYNYNPTFTLKVTDTYSGIRSIKTTVIENGTETVDVIDISNKAEKSGTAADEWTIKNEDDDSNLIYYAERAYKVNGNFNNMVILVELTDRAGNTSYDYYTFGIDKTAPVITVEMNDNDDDTYAGFFKEDRTYKVTVLERNFKNENVKFDVKVTDNNGKTTAVNVRPDFKIVMDGDKPLSTVKNGIEYYIYEWESKFAADGDYTFGVSVVDLAENETADEKVSYVNSEKENIREISNVFTIDKTAPIITVIYDNNDARNGNYYKADRTATLTIIEHNFDKTRIQNLGVATDNGAPSTFPSFGEWKAVGNNTYSTVVKYNVDSKYIFDIGVVDMAGNSIADYNADEFYIDKTAPSLEFSGVKDKSANKGKVAPVVTYSDTNFDVDAVEIKLVGANNGKVSYKGSYADITNGQTYTYSDFKKEQKVDDIYTLTVKLTDKAGNETEKYITFSANRFGSVYNLGEIKDILGKYLTKEKDIVFTEVNVDRLTNDSVKIKLIKNGEPTDLVKDKDYTVVENGGGGSWSSYKYTIKKALFADDGRYSITIYSKDAAGNVNENIDETKKAEISFGIDKTKPVVLPIDFESEVQYAVEMKTVSVEIKDNLLLEDVKIYLNGQELKYSVDGETYTFDIPKANSTQDVKIVVVDAAGNEEVIEINEFLVNANIFVRWYNNTPLFIGSIIGVVVIAIAIITYVLFGKKKKKD